LVFYGERGELGVGCEVAGGAQLFEITKEKAGKLRSGLKNDDRRDF